MNLGSRRGFLAVLVCLAAWLAIGLVNLRAEEKFHCFDLVGCRGELSCFGEVDYVVDCEMVCIGGGEVFCPVIEGE